MAVEYIRDHYIICIAFGACYLRGLSAAGSLRSLLPLALTLPSTIEINKIALFRFLALGGLGGAPKIEDLRVDLRSRPQTLSEVEFEVAASDGLGGRMRSWPRTDSSGVLTLEV